MTGAMVLLALVTLERLAELRHAGRNAARLIGRGGQEVGAGHYPLIVALHATWLAGLWILAWNEPVRPLWLVVFLLLQAGRLWVLVTLGERWTTRIIVEPGRPLVATGPYRLMAHPNYAIVAAEIAVLPLVFGLVGYALVFSLVNAVLLSVRIRVEDAALRRSSG
jgi:methyltransferase